MPRARPPDEYKSSSVQHFAKFAGTGREEFFTTRQGPPPQCHFAARQIRGNAPGAPRKPLLRHAEILDVAQHSSKAPHVAGQPRQARASPKVFALIKQTLHPATPSVKRCIRRLCAPRALPMPPRRAISPHRTIRDGFPIHCFPPRVIGQNTRRKFRQLRRAQNVRPHHCAQMTRLPRRILTRHRLRDIRIAHFGKYILQPAARRQEISAPRRPLRGKPRKRLKTLHARADKMRLGRRIPVECFQCARHLTQQSRQGGTQGQSCSLSVTGRRHGTIISHGNRGRTMLPGKCPNERGLGMSQPKQPGMRQSGMDVGNLLNDPAGQIFIRTQLHAVAANSLCPIRIHGQSPASLAGESAPGRPRDRPTATRQESRAPRPPQP